MKLRYFNQALAIAREQGAKIIELRTATSLNESFSSRPRPCNKSRSATILDRNYTQAKLKRRLEQVSKSVERYLLELERADRDEPQVREAKQQRLSEKLEKLEQEQQRLGRIEEMLKKEPDQQLSFTDPDARSMATSGKGTGVVGYNVQLAVEAEHHLIVSHEVTNVGHDRGQMLTMATQAQAATGVDALEAVLDRGYYKGEEIVACEQAGIRVYLPKPKTSNNQAKGLYGKQDFRYIVEDDEYECPAGQRLIWRMKTQERGQVLHRYWYSGCQNCALKAKCTPSAQRRVTRWEHEGILEAVQRRLDLAPEAMRLRRQTVEHPFGTIKGWMGATHFLTKRLPGVRAEMSLQVLAYNLKRVINLLGVGALIEAITA